MQHRFTNALAFESSPYLLQHAHNPVNWFPWGEEALQMALEQQKPILVSIGYAACHWCHVMERESFEQEDVAAFMNEHFINIKIDREERPDLDQVYMDAVQVITGSGGWPLNVFLTPEGKPFYGGTYFPPRRAYNRPSWMEVLGFISKTWEEKREELVTQADQLIKHLQEANRFYTGQTAAEALPGTEGFQSSQCRAVREGLMRMADTIEGGFGKAPKFPQTGSIRYLLAHGYLFGDQDAQAQAELSLDKMIRGGIYDQLRGGFARYSTDDKWLVPHFEKMLYDNALLLVSLCEAWQLTGNENYREAIDETMEFIREEMKDPDGGYYAALDADSEGEEGKFYVWDYDAFRDAAGENADRLCRYYGVTPGGNWESSNILNRPETDATLLAEWNLEPAAFRLMLREAKSRLLAARAERPRPLTDDKIILGWNALLLTAMCRVYACFAEERVLQEAISLYHFLRVKFDEDGMIQRHTYKNGQARHPAFLDDYAYLAEACIALQEITGNQEYLFDAKALVEFAVNSFYDEESGFFFYTRKGQADIITRKIEVFDQATPSGNSVMCANLFYLSRVFDRPGWFDMANHMLQKLTPLLLKHPASFSIWANEMLKECAGVREIIISGPDPSALRAFVLKTYIPGRVIQSIDADTDMPLLRGRGPGMVNMVFVCRNQQCEAPVSGTPELAGLLKNHAHLT